MAGFRTTIRISWSRCSARRLSLWKRKAWKTWTCHRKWCGYVSGAKTLMALNRMLCSITCLWIRRALRATGRSHFDRSCKHFGKKTRNAARRQRCRKAGLCPFTNLSPCKLITGNVAAEKWLRMRCLLSRPLVRLMFNQVFRTWEALSKAQPYYSQRLRK
jgi:hypothetical protein